jgi:hypothetical protein
LPFLSQKLSSTNAAALENKSDKLVLHMPLVLSISQFNSLMKRSISMGKTCNQSKQQWNARNYVQIKISISPDIAAAFKAKCAASGVSVTSELTRIMGGKPISNRIQKPAVDMYRTRRLRRNGLVLLIAHLGAIRDAERDYLDAIPANLETAPMHEAAEQTVSALDDALDSLCDAF